MTWDAYRERMKREAERQAEADRITRPGRDTKAPRITAAEVTVGQTVVATSDAVPLRVLKVEHLPRRHVETHDGRVRLIEEDTVGSVRLSGERGRVWFLHPTTKVKVTS